MTELLVNKEKTEVKEHKTKPPFRYTEGTLIKTMEELGIGRPSTYASTIESLKKSSYIYEEKNCCASSDDNVNFYRLFGAYGV